MAASVLMLASITTSRTKSAVRLRYLIFTFSLLCWSTAYFCWQISTTAGYAEFFCNALIASAAFIPITFYHSCLPFRGITTKPDVKVGYWMASILATFTCFGWTVEGVSERAGHPFWPDAGPLSPLFLIYFAYYFFACSIFLLKGISEHIGGRSTDQTFVFYSALIGFCGGSTNLVWDIQ